jgi:hypothetical protein
LLLGARQGFICGGSGRTLWLLSEGETVDELLGLGSSVVLAVDPGSPRLSALLGDIMLVDDLAVLQAPHGRHAKIRPETGHGLSTHTYSATPSKRRSDCGRTRCA